MEGHSILINFLKLSSVNSTLTIWRYILHELKCEKCRCFVRDLHHITVMATLIITITALVE